MMKSNVKTTMTFPAHPSLYQTANTQSEETTLFVEENSRASTNSNACLPIMYLLVSLVQLLVLRRLLPARPTASGVPGGVKGPEETKLLN